MPTLLEFCAGVVLVLTTLTAVGVMVRRLWRFVRLSVHAFETIQRELTPNGGGSTHDLVRKLAKRVDESDDKIAAVQSSAEEARKVALATAALTARQHGENVTRLDALEARIAEHGDAA